MSTKASDQADGIHCTAVVSFHSTKMNLLKSTSRANLVFVAVFLEGCNLLVDVANVAVADSALFHLFDHREVRRGRRRRGRRLALRILNAGQEAVSSRFLPSL